MPFFAKMRLWDLDNLWATIKYLAERAARKAGLVQPRPALSSPVQPSCPVLPRPAPRNRNCNSNNSVSFAVSQAVCDGMPAIGLCSQQIGRSSQWYWSNRLSKRALSLLFWEKWRCSLCFVWYSGYAWSQKRGESVFWLRTWPFLLLNPKPWTLSMLLFINWPRPWNFHLSFLQKWARLHDYVLFIQCVTMWCILKGVCWPGGRVVVQEKTHTRSLGACK